MIGQEEQQSRGTLYIIGNLISVEVDNLTINIQSTQLKTRPVRLANCVEQLKWVDSQPLRYIFPISYKPIFKGRIVTLGCTQT